MGWCRRCRRATEGRVYYCPACRRRRQAVRMRRKRQCYLDQGLCTRCGGPRDAEGLTCSRCLAEGKVLRRKVTRAKKALYMRTLMDRRREEGLCAYCGREIDQPAFKMCSRCRAHRVEYYRANWADHKYRAIKGGYNTQRGPVPLCGVCRLHHLKCRECGKWMGVSHGFRCVWRCRCGHRESFERPWEWYEVPKEGR